MLLDWHRMEGFPVLLVSGRLATGILTIQQRRYDRNRAEKALRTMTPLPFVVEALTNRDAPWSHWFTSCSSVSSSLGESCSSLSR